MVRLRKLCLFGTPPWCVLLQVVFELQRLLKYENISTKEWVQPLPHSRSRELFLHIPFEFYNLCSFLCRRHAFQMQILCWSTCIPMAGWLVVDDSASIDHSSLHTRIDSDTTFTSQMTSHLIQIVVAAGHSGFCSGFCNKNFSRVHDFLGRPVIVGWLWAVASGHFSDNIAHFQPL